MYTMGRSFRKDRSGDGRHLQDFTLFEWEALDTDHEWLLEFNSELIRYVIQYVMNKSSRYGLLSPAQHSTLYKHWKDGVKVIAYSEAIAYLQSIAAKNSEGNVFVWGDDLSASAEQSLTDKYGIVQVEQYPEDIKFFNMKRSCHKHEMTSTVECVDLLLPKAGETIGGSQREDDHDVLVHKLDTSIMLKQLTVLKEEHDGDGASARRAFDSYLKLFEGKKLVRSGSGLGLGRLLQFLMDSDEIIPF